METQSTPYLKDTQVANRYSVDRSTIWRWVKEGKLPKPCKLGIRSTRWRIVELEQWESSRFSREDQ